MENKKSRTLRFTPGRPFEFYHYTDLAEAESRSADIGFPPFCAHWAADGTLFVAGGGGTKGMGVRSAIVACRLVDRAAIIRDDLIGAFVDPEDLSSPARPLPIHPQLQTVGEVDTDDLIVSSISSSGAQIIPAAPFYVPFTPSSRRSTRRSEEDASDTATSATSATSASTSTTLSTNTLPGAALCSAVGSEVVVFDVRGNGSLSASPLPPFLSPSVLSDPSDTASTGLRWNPMDPAVPAIGRPSRRRLTARLRFPADFSRDRKDSFLSICVFSPDGRTVAAGGSDTIVRLFLLDDPMIAGGSTGSGGTGSFFSATGLRTPLPSSRTRARSGFFSNTDSHTPAHVPSLTPVHSYTPSHASSHSGLGPPPTVSPFCLPVAKHTSCVSRLCFSPDGRHLVTLSDTAKDGAQIWRMPSREQLRTYGIRIPIREPIVSRDDDDHKNSEAPNEAAVMEAAYFNADKVRPVNKIEWPNGMECRGMEFWSYPRLREEDHSTVAVDLDTAAMLPAAAVDSFPDVLIAICHVKRTGPSYLCEFRLSKAFYSGVEPAVLMSKTLVDLKCEASQLKISPNGHFIAVGTQHLHIFTGPACRALRNRDLLAQGFSARDESVRTIATLPPMTLVCEKRNQFDLPCTGIAFDPSSRLCAAVSASRGVAFLAVELKPKRSCVAKVVRVACCIPLWRAFFHSQLLKFIFNVLLIAFIGLIIQHYSMALSSSIDYEY